jgi:G3E family GTPase
MSDPRRPTPIPLTIITGFLGAGKTTLLNRLLGDPALADTVVIINEFGEIGLDHLFIEARTDGASNTVLMSSGCLCCTVRGELVSTLEDLLRDRDNHRIPPFRRAVIETTGLADPAPVLQSVLSHPYLVQRYAIDGVVTLIDAVNGEATLDTHIEAVKQAAVADRLVLTKTDLVPDNDTLPALVRRLRALNPTALLLDAARGEASPAALLDAGPFRPERKIGDVQTWLEAAMDDDHSAHDHPVAGAGQDVADPNRHDSHIRAFTLATDRAVRTGALDMFIDLLRSAHGPNLLRVKGLVKIAEDQDRPVVLHGVQHVFHPPVLLPAWPDQDRRTRLVFITRDLPESFVRGLWDALLGIPQPDKPDMAALTDNPLSLRRG